MTLNYIFILLLATLLSGCGTTNPTPATLDQIVYNKQSMTKALKGMSSDFTVTLLKSGVEDQNYVRIVALNLDNTPVIAAISSTSLNDGTFLNILKNSKGSSIGNILFAENSPITRGDNMHVTSIRLEQIQNATLNHYLSSLGYAQNQKFIKRHSYFYYKTETMDLIEYILPSLNKFIKN